MDQTLPAAERTGRGLSRWAQDSDPFQSMNREMARLFDDMIRGFGLPVFRGAFAAGTIGPRVDVHETDRELVLEAELPGVARNEIDVTLVDDLLTIRGEKRGEETRRSQDYHIAERSYGAFSRTIRLPFAANPEQIEASCTNGLLTVRIPKPGDTSRAHRRIEVKAGDGKPEAEAGRHLGQPAEPGPGGVKPGTAKTAVKPAS